MSKESSTTNTSEQNVPDLNDIINQITSNGEFKNMMDNLSGELKTPVDEISEVVDTETNNNNLNKEDLYDMMTTFLSDSEGNCLADILSNINKNLTIISTELSSAVKINKTLPTPPI
jgi:hypothetical protein